MALLVGVTKAGKRLISYDIRPVCEANALKNIPPELAKQWDFVTKRSDQGAEDFPDGSVSFFHLDGDHKLDVVRRDLAAWLPKMDPNGIMCGHDCLPEGERVNRVFGVMAVVTEFAEQHKDRFRLQILKHDWGMFILWPRN